MLGDQQTIPGYCLLLSDPVVPALNALPRPARRQFMHDLAIVGDALLEVTGAQLVN